MQSFGDQTERAIDTLLQKATTTFNYTTAIAYELAVGKTPIASGDAISNWRVSVGGGSEISLVSFKNPEESPVNASTSWSNFNSQEIGALFFSMFYDWIRDEDIMQHYKLINDTDYILLLENGGYSGHLYDDGDPYIQPFYWGNPTPFTLTKGGVSHKLRRLHAVRGMVKSAARRASRTEYPKIARYFNK